MKSSITVIKKLRGRPKSTGIGTLVGIRFHDSELKAIDEWRKKQTEKLSRPQAIRRLVKRALERK